MTQLISYGSTESAFEQATSSAQDKAPEIKIIQKQSTFLDEQTIFDNRGKFYLTDSEEIVETVTGIVLYRFESYSAFDNETDTAYFTNDIFKTQDGDMPIYIFKKKKDSNAQEIVKKASRNEVKEFMKEINGKSGYKNHFGILIDGKIHRFYAGGGSTDSVFSFLNSVKGSFYQFETTLSTKLNDSGDVKFYECVITKGEKTKEDHMMTAKTAFDSIASYWANKIQDMSDSIDISPTLEEAKAILSA